METLKINQSQLEKIHSEFYDSTCYDSPISIQLRKLDKCLAQNSCVKNHEIFDYLL